VIGGLVVPALVGLLVGLAVVWAQRELRFRRDRTLRDVYRRERAMGVLESWSEED
jgi:hypothetical protein